MYIINKIMGKMLVEGKLNKKGSKGAPGPFHVPHVQNRIRGSSSGRFVFGGIS